LSVTKHNIKKADYRLLHVSLYPTPICGLSNRAFSLLLGIFLSSLMKILHLSQLFCWSPSRIGQNSPKSQGKINQKKKPKKNRKTNQKPIYIINETGYSLNFRVRKANIFAGRTGLWQYCH